MVFIRLVSECSTLPLLDEIVFLDNSAVASADDTFFSWSLKTPGCTCSTLVGLTGITLDFLITLIFFLMVTLAGVDDDVDDTVD